MLVSTCDLCRTANYDWEPPHECTEFFVTSEDESNESFWVENPKLILKGTRRVPDLEDAAEAWAIRYNEGGEYTLMGEEMTITLTRDGKTQSFIVGAEPDVHYSVREVEDEAG